VDKKVAASGLLGSNEPILEACLKVQFKLIRLRLVISGAATCLDEEDSWIKLCVTTFD
jgi:hypothetical protein